MVMVAETDFRHVLKKELEKRCETTPRYSLRAFARDLNLAPSRLSEVISGKQGLSGEAAKKIAVALKMPEDQAELFCDLVESQHGRAKVQRDLARIRLQKHRLDAYHYVDPDVTHAIADWYHMGILQLITLPAFQNDVKWISKALKITQVDAAAALKRLKRLDLIRETDDGRLEPTHENIATRDEVPSAVYRRAHQQILLRAIDAIETQPVDHREYSASMIPIDEAMIPEAKRWLKNFRRRFSRRLDRSGNKNRVYCLSMQFFDLTEDLKTQDQETPPGN